MPCCIVNFRVSQHILFVKKGLHHFARQCLSITYRHHAGGKVFFKTRACTCSQTRIDRAWVDCQNVHVRALNLHTRNFGNLTDACLRCTVPRTAVHERFTGHTRDIDDSTFVSFEHAR